MKKMKWKNPQRPKKETQNRAVGTNKDPIVTSLAWLREAISVLWSDAEEICSAPWDHMIKEYGMLSLAV